jgi:hypothetical protein
MLGGGILGPGKTAGLAGLKLLDLFLTFLRGKGCQYRPISAATITNATHRNSKPRIQ